MDDDFEDEVPPSARVDALIAAMAAFHAALPITVELSPYRNRYTGEVQGVVLTDLFADEPGKGTGGTVVRELLRLADEADLTVYTDAQGPQSARFYERMGFERSAGRGHQFAHHPPLPDHMLGEDGPEVAAFGM